MIRSIAAAVAIGVLVFAALQVRSCHKDAVTAATAAAQARADEHRQAATAWEAQALQQQIALAECQSQWADAQAAARDLIAAQVRADAERERELQAWQRRWDSRSASCGDALAAMRDACADEVGAW